MWLKVELAVMQTITIVMLPMVDKVVQVEHQLLVT